MDKFSHIVKRLKLALNRPDLNITFTNDEIIQVSLALLTAIEKTNVAIANGKIKGEPGKDARPLVPGKDYLTEKQQKQIIEAMMTAQFAKMDKELTKAIENLQDGLDGDDAEITEEHIAEAARRARELIELPDFAELITMEPTSIRDALELLQGDERLSADAINGLDERFEELRRTIVSSGNRGGGLTTKAVLQLITENATGDSLPDQTGNNGKFLTTDGTDASWATLAGGGDMAAATYDPTAVGGDAFDMDNMVEGTTNKILTAAERAILGNTSGTNTGDQDLSSYQVKPAEGAFVDGDKTKLDGIEASADVTDATNVGAAMTGATAKTTPVDADTMPLNDSAAANVLKKVTWANIKATLKAYFDTIYQAAGSYLTVVTASDVDAEASADGYVLTSDGAGNAAWEALPVGTGDLWSDPVDSDILPDVDSTRDIGANANRFALGYFDYLYATNDLTIGGSINGVVSLAVSTEIQTPAISASSDNITINSLANGHINLAPNGSGEAQVAGQRIIDETDIGSTVQAYDANLPTWPATVDATEVGHLNGVTSAIQTQLDAKLAKAGGTMTGDIAMGDQDITGAGSISFTQELDNGSKTASFSVDFSTDNHQKATLTANTMTITFDTTSIGVGVYTLKLVNAGLATITWAGETGSVYWAGGTEPTWTSSGTDIISVYFDGTNFYCQGAANFS